MRNLIEKKLAIAAIALATGCQSPKINPPLDHVIVSERHTVTVAYWVPTTIEVQKAETALVRLYSQTNNRGQKPKHPLSEYVVRYYGDTVDQKRVIFGNGFHKSQATVESLEKEDSDPRRIVSQVFGGGQLFFSFRYEIESDEIKDFYFNASK